MASFKKYRTSKYIDGEEVLVLSDRFRTFRKKDYSPFNLNEMTESECLSELIDLEKETFRCNSFFHIKFFYCLY